jgi:hypothetical protein
VYISRPKTLGPGSYANGPSNGRVSCPWALVASHATTTAVKMVLVDGMGVIMP